MSFTAVPRGAPPPGVRAPVPRRGYCRSPKQLVARADLTDAAKILLAALAGLCWGDNREGTPSIYHIADACGWAGKTWKVKRAMTEVVKAGLVDRFPCSDAPGYVWTTRLLYDPSGYDDVHDDAENPSVRVFDPSAPAPQPQGAGAPTPERQCANPRAQVRRPQSTGATPSSRSIQTVLDLVDDVDAGTSPSTVSTTIESENPVPIVENAIQEKTSPDPDPAPAADAQDVACLAVVAALVERASKLWPTQAPEMSLRVGDLVDKSRSLGYESDGARAAVEYAYRAKKGPGLAFSMLTEWSSHGKSLADLRSYLAALAPKPTSRVEPVSKPVEQSGPIDDEDLAKDLATARDRTQSLQQRRWAAARVRLAAAQGYLKNENLDGLPPPEAQKRTGCGACRQTSPAAGARALYSSRILA
ncbi:hypothetical protein [Paludisphaera rhizosphaerae]|uniref:hypothetical protein n=1 Tax=Paludisphaera rhizosphaerae TaxID=2711216 RepID=UPI0013EABE5D|nr:hypothetical protein [Paludisphaera rhizosphaerae]